MPLPTCFTYTSNGHASIKHVLGLCTDLSWLHLDMFQRCHIATDPSHHAADDGSDPALEAVDKLLLSKEAISAVARQHGLQVTLQPTLQR